MCRVLVADVEGSSRDLLVQALSMDGHETIATASASEALTRVAEGKVDVLIAEVNLPDRQAWDLFPEVHGLDPSVPLIAVSADDSWETSKRVRSEAGPVFYYGLKPLNMKEIREATLAAQAWKRRMDGS